MERYYKDIREFVETLERHNKLRRISRPFNRETEISPLVFLQYRGLPEQEWKCFLFERVVDVKGRQYEPKLLVGAYAASPDIFALGMMCPLSEINEKWAHAVSHPIDPVIVTEGLAQEVVIRGDDVDLEWLPLVVDQPGFSGTIRTTTQIITKDPESGIRNVGHYSAHLRGKRKMFFGVGHGQGSYVHWLKCKAKGIPLEVAVVIGAAPNISYASSAKLPYGFDELTVAGGIAREPVPLVKCKTVDLEVPAMAEMVIEGIVKTELLEPYAAYGDYPSYMFKGDYSPTFEVTCMTHRRDAMFVTHLVGFMAQESNIEASMINAAALYKHLKYDCGCQVTDVAFHLSGGGNDYCVIQVKKGSADDPWRAMYAAAAYRAYGLKVLIAVDTDINPHDADLVNWALSFAMQPTKDIRVIPDRPAALDPSACSPDRENEFHRSTSSAILIDATRKWPYPPVGLPKKVYMENALHLWKELGLPELKLKTPWYGYELGNWTEEDREYADLIVRGEYLAVGEKLAGRAITRP